MGEREKEPGCSEKEYFIDFGYNVEIILGSFRDSFSAVFWLIVMWVFYMKYGESGS